MKPVEIEFLMRDNLTAGLDNSKKSVEQLLAISRRASADIGSKIEEQRKVIDGVTSDLDKMQRKLQGLQPGGGQRELLVEIGACKKVLAEEIGMLEKLEQEHQQAKQGVSDLESEYRNLSMSEEHASVQSKTLTSRIREQKDIIKQVETDVRSLQKAYDSTAPGKAKGEAAAELGAAKKALEEEKGVLAGLTAEQEKARESGRRLSRQLRELQDAMAKMRLNGEENTDAYRKMAQEAANLSDTISDLHAQTKILANDDANLQGFISGVNGLSGAFTTATGVMSLFASENENLQKVQARVQSVMAITMGLQQVFNTLNKDSAFRLVTVTKVKNLLTAANYRLATSLGISTAAAKALMATLTLGLSLAITGLIVAWDKYSDAQEAAAKKAQERVEIESQGRAEMLKTRFEIDATRESLKNFTGSKEEEKTKCDELNRKYGEAFGYYETISEWYDVLTEKSGKYIEMLFLQAQVQALVNKAVEADEELNKHKATKPGHADTDVGWWEGMWMRMAFPTVGSIRKAQSRYNNRNQELYDNRTAELEQKKEDYLKEAKALMEASAAIGKEFNLGGNVKPTKKPTTSIKAHEKEIAAEQKRAQELLRLRQENEQKEIEQLKDGADKRRRQIKFNYEKERAEIEALEENWRKAQGGKLTDEQRNTLKDAYSLAQSGMEKELREVEADEVKKGREKLDKLITEYKDYDQKRRDIDNAYATDNEMLQTELQRMKVNGEDTSDIEATIRARAEAYRNEIQSLQGDILQSTEFYDKLFSDTSEKGYKVLRDFYVQAKDVLDKGKMDSDGVEISVPYKDADGKFVTKAVKVTVAEFRKMKKQVDAIRKELEKENPFSAFYTSWKDLSKALKEDGDVNGALKNLNARGKEVTQTMRGWGESLGAVFGDRFSQSMDEIMTFCDGMMDMGTGIAQIWSGDIVGGITNTLRGLSSVVSMFSSWKEKMEEMKREWWIAEIETNRAIRERAESYAADRSKISDIIDEMKTLNWLVEKGYARVASVSAWEAQLDALRQYQQNLRSEMTSNDALWERLQGSNAHWEWGNSLNGGSVTHTLRGMSAEQIELYYNQNKLSDAAKAYYEAWRDSGKSVETLKKNIEDCYQSMQEMVMGVSFDSFLSNARTALMSIRKEVGALGEFTEDTLAEAILNAFMYKGLAKALEPLYNELSEHLIDGTANKDYIGNWKQRFSEMMSAAGERLDAMADALGINLDNTSGTRQAGKSGGFNAMSQDQGTKLEGLFVSGLQHWTSMDAHVEDVASKMSSVQESLVKIIENTGKNADVASDIHEELKKIIRDGLKMK